MNCNIPWSVSQRLENDMGQDDSEIALIKEEEQAMIEIDTDDSAMNIYPLWTMTVHTWTV